MRTCDVYWDHLHGCGLPKGHLDEVHICQPESQLGPCSKVVNGVRWDFNLYTRTWEEVGPVRLHGMDAL